MNHRSVDKPALCPHRSHGTNVRTNAGAARALLAAAVLSGIALSGCMVGPDYQQPQAPVNSGWLDTAGKSQADAAAEARWWEVFNDPTLSALVTQAYGQNLSLRTAGLRVIEGRARRDIAVGNFFPQVQAAVGDVGIARLSANTPSGQSIGQTDRSFSEANIGLSAAWELDFWGKFRRGIEASDADLLASVADYDAVLTTLAADVATAYILIRSFEERLEIAKVNVSLQDKTLHLTEVRFRAGDVSELDVFTAKALLANTQASIPDLENSLQQTKLTLCVLLGRAPSSLEAELASAPGVLKKVPTAPAEIAAGIPADLLRRRPDVRAAERRAAAQSAVIGIATADLFPQIALVGATGFASSTFEGIRRPDLGDIANSDSFTGFLGLRVNWPILNYGRIENGIRVQDARFEQTVAAYQETVIRAAADVESGLSEFLRARDREAFLAVSVAANQRTADLSFLQYRLGVADFIRVNEAQTSLAIVEDTLVTAKTRIALGVVRSYRALGGGWEIRGDHEFIDAATAKRMRDRTDWGNVIADEARPAETVGSDSAN